MFPNAPARSLEAGVAPSAQSTTHPPHRQHTNTPDRTTTATHTHTYEPFLCRTHILDTYNHDSPHHSAPVDTLRQKRTHYISIKYTPAGTLTFPLSPRIAFERTSVTLSATCDRHSTRHASRHTFTSTSGTRRTPCIAANGSESEVFDHT